MERTEGLGGSNHRQLKRPRVEARQGIRRGDRGDQDGLLTDVGEVLGRPKSKRTAAACIQQLRVFTGGAPLCVCRWQGWSAAGSPARRSSRWGRLAPAVNSVGKSAMTSGGALVLQVTGAGRVKGIRWGWPRNCGLNGKTERKRRDERDVVLTFDQRWTTATEKLAGVAEESPELGKMTESTSDSRNPPHHGVELDEGNSRVVSICTGSARFRQKSSPEVHRNLVDAKVRRGFVGARVIET
jgi:hypothetical protein